MLIVYANIYIFHGDTVWRWEYAKKNCLRKWAAAPTLVHNATILEASRITANSLVVTVYFLHEYSDVYLVFGVCSENE